MPKIKDYDLWMKPCRKCGYDAGRVAKKNSAHRCWKCNSLLTRDFSERALKKECGKL